jgi:phosphopantetheine adenylyltransferase/dephospho-CoA kinase
VIVLEIALLLEAGWQEKVHQIWVAIIDEKEAIKRLKERSGLEENEAKNIISFQMSNHEKVQKANIVLCTYWDHEFTMKQVTKAWNQTQKYL